MLQRDLGAAAVRRVPTEWLEPGSWYVFGAATTVSGAYPDSRAAADVTSLKVDPGGKTSRTARFFSGSSELFRRESQFAFSADVSWVASRFGS